MNIGSKIKRLRQANGLTLEELANRSELTKGFLSQLERDLTSPSVATLEDILEALGTNLQEFFSEKPAEQIVFKKDDFFINEQDDYIISYIIPNAQKNEMEPILIELDKQKQSMIIDPHEGQEFGYVVQGKIKLIYGDNEFILKKGETFYLKGLVSHYIVNPSETRAKVIWVSTPPLF
ncbi:helix-turn-helix domain-containing protein [Thomasclavelia cocleata]|jgi:transcriptional regulator with XRE-family HTH domain|uniref:HTH-type transcriptional regulator PuuR n=2 Tax=Thomasclavelia cocleata TaxID=69824 RepID=A0A829Z8K5_9FIRM|nr:XRE family transcriptional regulator [Thomasclavelia cocleata]MCI9131463.1 cupin domain-containing protein [Thomasclavelia cocleata]MCI9630154.1 cupin domain-containing protein [Thomasclavelia cocleata]GFI40476.1 HTH-type transcriptional regulator PuuR [Thomasclavelia cocleata]